MLGRKRKKYILTPWKVGVAGSLVSVAFAIPFAFLSGVHRVPLPFDISLPTIYLVVFIPFASTVWALIGIGRRKRDGNISWCYFSIFLSMMSVAFALVSTFSN